MGTKRRSDLRVVPMLAQETLYVGIDIGKVSHVAGFIAPTLLSRYQRFEHCPALTFANSREGFRMLVDRIETYVPLTQVYVVLEFTGHYHRTLTQYLQEQGIPVYALHNQKRQAGLLKTDKRDALNLANLLYNQLEKGIQTGDPFQAVRRLAAPTPAAAQLRGMVRHRYELINESTQRKNKLIAICDELFPELTQIYKDPNLPSALALREHFPTPAMVAAASLSELKAVRIGKYPSDAKLQDLQRLAAQSIGVKDAARLRGLTFEQKQLIKELQVIEHHLEDLEAEITQVIQACREGKILTSIPGIGAVPAASILAQIGSITNFSRASQLKSYFGWAPTIAQSGKTLDRAHLSLRGTRLMKRTMYLIVWKAIQTKDSVWAEIYEHLIPIKCSYNERMHRYTGRGRVIGRIAGQIISVIFTLLKQDQETLSKLPPGVEPPEPVLYDAQLHRQHRAGQYHSQTSRKMPSTFIQLPLL
jgi:transposase